MKVKVTQEDIRRGSEGMVGGCPISQAMTRQLDQLTLVDYDVVAWGNQHYLSSPEMRKFVQDFDAGLPVEPFEIETDNLEKTVLTIERAGVRGSIALIRRRAQRLYWTMLVSLGLSVLVFLIVALVSSNL